MPWFSTVILTSSRFLVSLFKLEKKKKILKQVKNKILLPDWSGEDEVMMSEIQAAWVQGACCSTEPWEPIEPDRILGNMQSFFRLRPVVLSPAAY